MSLYNDWLDSTVDPSDLYDLDRWPEDDDDPEYLQQLAADAGAYADVAPDAFGDHIPLNPGLDWMDEYEAASRRGAA